MSEEEQPDLAGVYVTDDYIDVLLGQENDAVVRKTRVSELDLDYTVNGAPNLKTFHFSDTEPEADTFERVANWIAVNTHGLRSVGLGTYGPFFSLDRNVRGKSRHYGHLQTTSHGRLTDVNIYDLLHTPLSKKLGRSVKVTIDTDVAVGVVGLVYQRSRRMAYLERQELEDKIIVFVRLSLGVGGAFLRESTPWQGRLHPEIGQINVPRWTSKIPEQMEIERSWTFGRARNKGSIEGLASVPAIEARFQRSFQELLQEPEHIAWKRQAWYIAQLAWTLTCSISPDQIVLGGRVMMVPGLIERVHSVFKNHVAGHASFPYYDEMDDPKSYLVASIVKHGETDIDLPQHPGIVGALCMAAMEDQPSSVTTMRSIMSE